MTLGGVLALGLLAASAATTALSDDFYPSFTELARHEIECVDYLVSANFRHDPVTVMAIHAGYIELGTGELARVVASDDFNLYLFEGIKAAHNERLHVTSANFDEPRALELARRSRRCVSIHGFRETQRQEICVGGGNTLLRDRMSEALRVSGLPIQVESPCVAFSGASPENIVNRCVEGGVQLELSTALRMRLAAEPELQRELVAVIRGVMIGGD